MARPAGEDADAMDCSTHTSAGSRCGAMAHLAEADADAVVFSTNHLPARGNLSNALTR